MADLHELLPSSPCIQSRSSFPVPNAPLRWLYAGFVTGDLLRSRDACARTLENPFRPRLSPMYPVHSVPMSPGWDRSVRCSAGELGLQTCSKEPCRAATHDLRLALCEEFWNNRADSWRPPFTTLAPTLRNMFIMLEM
jgi:hypothetical protein